MTTAIDSKRQQTKPAGRGLLAAWSGIVGALLLAAANWQILSLSPPASEANAAQTISEFYAKEGNTGGLLVAEPLSIVGAFFFLWFLAHLATLLSRETASTGSHRILAGGVTFVVLAFASMVAQTTVAGARSFYSAFEVDPYTSMALSHAGYILLVGAMAGTAVLLAGAGALIRRGSTVSRWLGSTAYVLVPLSLISMLFPYLPLALFLLWITLVSISLLRSQRAAAS